ncbi:baseplate J/gp47 family protein [Halomonas sp. GT]|uniref:baseplate J/gp47 family protein n=1 Tax=Halomonas sp. GT TaxID=1971364 RepID=UPI0009F5B365|nr:baseplate J/gp47 family protein [Halomonas sp. GT]
MKLVGPIDLSLLPAPIVIEPLDYEAIYAERRAALLDLVDPAQREAVESTLALESEPLTKLLQENAYRELVWRQRVNEAAQALMLAYSRESDLDQLAANYNVERLTIHPGDPSAVPPIPPVKESDSQLRIRAQQAWEGLSVAGPRSAYVFYALSADGQVADATTVSPSPAVAVVTVLSVEGDGTAPPDLLQRVDTALSADDIRPVADRLTVQSAQIIDYHIDATLYVNPGPEQEPILDAARASIEHYITEQRRLGRDIRRSAIYAALHVEGVHHVGITAPAADLPLDPTQAGHCTSIELTIEVYDG